jgi:hypothetical protein
MLKHNLLLLAWCVLAAAASAAEPRVSIEPAEKWSDVFADHEVKFHHAIRAAAPLEGRLHWSLSVQVRTVAQGELPLKTDGRQPVELTVPLKTPTVKQGVIVQSQLTLAAYADGEQKPVASHSRPLWIFPRDPFAYRRQWLKELRITLLDPEGKTADVLGQAGIPYKLTRNTAALDGLTEGLLVVGEGVAWRDYRALGEAMGKAAARGVPVLCLAPGEGTMALPGSEGADLPAPSGISLRREEIITQLDKRLDAVAWPPEGQIAASRLSLKSDRQQVVIEATRDEHGWPWLEVSYPTAKGRLILCGFGIIRQWEAGPAPRYLLAELLRLAATEKTHSALDQEMTNPPPHEERKDQP